MQNRPQCLVLMPFGKKPDGSGNVVDFDLVYLNLIAPAIQSADTDPLRWDDVAMEDSINRAVFEQLLESDFVLADLSIASRRVFYELGIRHALKPSGTILIANQSSTVHFDLAELRMVRYRLNQAGRPEENEEFKRDVAGFLRLGPGPIDSPVYQALTLQPPYLSRGAETKLSRASANSLSGLAWKHRISKAKYGGIDDMRKLESEMTDVSPEVLLELFKAYRAVGAWKELIAVSAKIPPGIALSAVVQEPLALALNRTGEVDRAEALLRDILRRNGPSSETFGLLGRIYKDRWRAAAAKDDPSAARFLDQAIESYVQGFEQDWRDYYPGINAITLMDVRESPDPRREEMIPVRYAMRSKRKLAEIRRRLLGPRNSLLELGSTRRLERRGKGDRRPDRVRAGTVLATGIDGNQSEDDSGGA